MTSASHFAVAPASPHHGHQTPMPRSAKAPHTSALPPAPSSGRRQHEDHLTGQEPTS